MKHLYEITTLAQLPLGVRSKATRRVVARRTADAYVTVINAEEQFHKENRHGDTRVTVERVKKIKPVWPWKREGIV